MRTFSLAEKKFIFTSALILFCLVFFLVIPLAYCRMVLREPLSNMGWQRGEGIFGFFWPLLSVAIAFAGIFFLTWQFPAFAEAYTFPVAVETNFLWFVLYELFMVPFIVLIYESFFRGLVQMLWLQALGAWAILVQAALFTGLVYVSDGFTWETLPLLVFAPFAGYIAYKTHSLWYAFLGSWTFLFLTDVLFLILR